MKPIIRLFVSAVFSVCLLLSINSSLKANVGPDGSFNYSIPIELPQGTAGCAPSLALVYNSNNGNGMLGQGWKLEGLDAITRDTTHSVNYDSGTDYYVGPGGRMVSIPSGTFQGCYHYENEMFNHIEPYGSQGDGPSYWIETKPDGTKYYYGHESDTTKSQIWALNPQGGYITYASQKCVRVWALSKVEDLNGNYYTIEYEQDNGEYYPKKITYTENIGFPINIYRTLEFSYDTTGRPDHGQSYTYGCSVETKWRVYKIDVILNGSTVQTYEMTYETGEVTGTSRLKKVTNDGSADGEWSFGWSNEYSTDPIQFWTHTTGSIGASNIYNHYFVDTNGDGKADWIQVHRGVSVGYIGLAQPDSNFQFWTHSSGSIGNIATYFHYHADVNGDGRADWIQVHGGVNAGYIGLAQPDGNFQFWTHSTGSIGATGYYFHHQADVNGDGRADWIQVHGGAYAGYIGLAQPNGNFQYWTYSSASIGPTSTYNHYFADVNGDGRADWFQIHRSVNAGYISLAQPDGNFQFWTYSTGNAGAANTYDHYFVDINGDGRADWIQVHKSVNEAHIGLAQPDGNFQFWTYSTNKVGAGNTYDHYFADINGDGRVDWIQVHKSVNEAYIGLGQPDGNFQFWTYPINNVGAGNNYTHYFADINGDGRADWIQVHRSTNVGYIGTNEGPLSNFLISIKPPLGSTTTIDYKPAPQFVDNISIDDTASGGKDKAVDSTSSNYPYIANSSPRNLVESVKTNDGRGSGVGHDLVTKYSYKNGRFYTGFPYQRKNLYFECITQQQADPVTGSGPYTKTYYKQGTDTDSHYYAGKIEEVKQYDSVGNLMKRQKYEYYIVEHPFATGINLVKQQSVTDYTYEIGTTLPIFTNTKTFYYDAGGNYSYGMPTQITEHSSDTTIPDTTTAITYNTNTNKWVLNKPGEIKQTSGSTVLKWQTFGYNEYYDITSKMDWLNTDSKWIVTSYLYDDYGNVRRVTVPNAAGTTSITETIYDTSYHTFPETVISYKGGLSGTQYIVVTHYDPATGNKLDELDLNGQTTSYIYDEFERLKEVDEPGVGWTKKIEYKNWGDPNNQYTEVQTRDNSSDGSHKEREYFDGLKRKYRTESEGYNDGSNHYYSVVTYDYDSLGRLSRQSNPYLALVNSDGSMSNCDTPYYTTYSYDSASRLTTKAYPDGTSETTTYSYGTNRQVVNFQDKKGVIHKSKYDPKGKLRQKIDDPSGINASISYDYDALGNLTATMDSIGNITGISYDTLGRKTSILDPNVGITSYTYWDSGQIKKQRDAKGIDLNYTYDELNRLRSVISSDYPVTVNEQYEYDEAYIAGSIAKGRLSKVKDNSGETTFAYDARGNVIGYIKGIDDDQDGDVDKTFRKVEMTYDYQKRVDSIKYPDPDGTVIKKQYADAGYLKAVTDVNNNAFVQYTREKGASGTPLCSNNTVERITGNGVITSITYDPKNYRPINVITAKGSTILDNISYSFDTIGNIKKITDNYPYNPLNNNPEDDTEIFTTDDNTIQGYDNLNRLIHANSPYLYGEKYFTYSSNGRLTRRGGIDLNYEDPEQPGHPDAVKYYDGKRYTYDDNGNMISRLGKILVYDAKNRLIAIKNSTTLEVEEKYTYDYSGFRVRKEIIATDEVVYNINGLYELKKNTDDSYRYTNFIYGMDGDIVAQFSNDTTSGFAPINSSISIGMLNWENLKNFFLKIYEAASALVKDPNTVRYINIFIIILAILVMLSIWVYNVFIRQRHTILVPRWMHHAVPAMLIIFVTTFGLPGCFDPLLSLVNMAGIRYFHPNHLGSVKLITLNDGTVETFYKYDPYGKLLEDKSNNWDVYKYKYTGQEADSTTDLYNYGARFYDPDLGRFITPDTIVPDPTNSQMYNRYMYANNNPMRYNDPTGHEGEEGGYMGDSNCMDSWSGNSSTYQYNNSYSNNYYTNLSFFNYNFNNFQNTANNNDNLGAWNTASPFGADLYSASGVSDKGKKKGTFEESLVRNMDVDESKEISIDNNRGYLSFNGKFISINNPDGSIFYRVPAVSGRPDSEGNFDYSTESQAKSDKGPIPNGKYYVNSQEIQFITNYQNFIGTTGGIFGMKIGSWPGGSYAWGEARLDIQGVAVNGRSGFTIHGGYSWGSAGCIDTGPYVIQFLSALYLYSNGATKIPLYVNYGK